MSDDQTTISVNGGPPQPFDLEHSPPPGKLPQRVIDELIQSRRIAKDYAQAFSDAAKAQAQKYGIKPQALKRFIAALDDDSTAELREELDDLEGLLS